jgi:hypothetical protein
MKTNRLWVVEMDVSQIAGNMRFEPTVGVALSRRDGRVALAEWRAENPGTKFRLVHYVPSSWREILK